MPTMREGIRRFNDQLLETLGLMRDVARKRPKARFATEVERDLDDELRIDKLTTNEE